MTQKSVIIVAGGSGTRMKQPLPKQFLMLAEKPLLVHTIEAFLAFDPGIRIILVLPGDNLSIWEGIRSRYFQSLRIENVEGGVSRFQSVKAGLSQVHSGLVAIHDAVRPLISPLIISESFNKAKETGSGVVMVPLKDSIRQIINAGLTNAEDRSRFYLVQTPQTFKVELIKRAFELEESESFTDDATVFEANGGKVTPVMGDYRNIKITTPEDLQIAEALMK